jgi:predicted ABC-type ATPase
MHKPRPSVIALAGPNGAGKSTAGPALVRDALGVHDYVDADAIARGLSVFDPDRAAIAAGRVMLSRLHEMAEAGLSFAFETTLSSRSFAPWIEKLVRRGYGFHLVFLFLPSPEVAVMRVRKRVKHGGHSVPEATVRRRWDRGLRNFFQLYRPLATTWRVYDNAGNTPRLVAAGSGEKVAAASATWERIREQVERA